MPDPKSVPVPLVQWVRLFSEHSQCPRNHRRVLWELAAFAHDDGSWARPGTRLLAARVGLAKDDSIAPALEWARRAGWIRRTMRGNFRQRQSDVYQLTAPTQVASENLPPQTPAEGGTVSSGVQPTTTDDRPLIPGLTRRETNEFWRIYQAREAAGITYGDLNMHRPGDKRFDKLTSKSRTFQVQNGKDWVI